MTKELRDYLIKTYGLKDGVKDGALELTYPREIAAYEEGYEQAKKDNTPQWHYPSKGELPGNARVICFTKYVDIWIGERIDENTKRYKWKLFTDRFEEYYGDDEIIAWQLLELPKETKC